MADGIQVRTLEELREHFDLGIVLEYYASGRLDKWLKNGYYDKEAEKIRALDSASNDFKKSLCDILSVPYLESDDEHIDLDDIAKRNERRRYLRQFTDDDKILAADNVAFTQDELENLLKKHVKKIYLCGDFFTIPANKRSITYIGINNPMVIFRGETIVSGIDFQGLQFDISSYIDEDKFFSSFADNLILGVRLLNIAAEKGSAAAQYYLGLCYENGCGVEEDIEEAIEWYQKAAAQGNAEAQCRLGICYKIFYYGGNYAEKAADLFRKAASQGVERAQALLGKCYYYGDGVKQDYAEALKWCRKAVAQGEAELVVDAQAILGMCYYYGDGVEKNYIEAVKWCRRAANQKNKLAQTLLGFCYYKGRGVEQSYKEAVNWFQEATEQDEKNAQRMLGICYCEGKGVLQNDREGIRWYKKASEQGEVNATISLAFIYTPGFERAFVEPNILEAAKWFRRAAEQGSEEAKDYLDNIAVYFKDRKEKNIEWYRKAVDENDVEAQSYLGMCYEEGHGVEEDVGEAIEWYHKAAAQGNAEASKNSIRCNMAIMKNNVHKLQELVDDL